MNPIVQTTLENLKRNGFGAQYFDSREEAVKAVLSAIDPEESVGFGGSITV